MAAKTGRKPKPPEARKGRAKIEGAVPKLAGRPDCPPHLDGLAREKWAEMVALLDAMGVLSRGDADLLAIYCETYSKYRACLDRLKTPEDMVIVSPKGFQLNSPWINLRNALAKELARLLAEFGLSPSARSRVAGPGSGEDDALMAWLRNK